MVLGQNISGIFFNAEQQIQNQSQVPGALAAPDGGGAGGKSGGGGPDNSGGNSGGNYVGGQGDAKKEASQVNETAGRNPRQGMKLL